MKLDGAAPRWTLTSPAQQVMESLNPAVLGYALTPRMALRLARAARKSGLGLSH